jgi:hypothetical protein
MEQIIINRKKERGQSMVELALSFTVLLFLLMGVVDLGRAFFAFQAMRDAAQEGAVYGSMFPLDSNGNFNSNGIINRVKFSSSKPVNLNDPFIRVDPSYIGTKICYGSGIRVDVYWDSFPLLFPFWEPLFGINSVPIHARVEDTILRPPCK